MMRNSNDIVGVKMAEDAVDWSKWNNFLTKFRGTRARG